MVRTIEQLRGAGEARILAALSDHIARAFLLEGEAQMMALDFNARLVTELREARIWPKKLKGKWKG